jgi:hypothetical protein
LRELSCCNHGHHQGQMRHFPQESDRSNPVPRMGSLICSQLPSKTTWVLDSGYRRFWVRFYATETNRDLHRSSQRWKIDNHTSHVAFLQYCVGTCKNNTSPKITFAYNSGCEHFRELQLCQKLRYLSIILGEK